MISITKLLTDESNFGDSLRYNRSAAYAKDGVSADAGPVVVWNCTKNMQFKVCALLCSGRYEAARERDDS